MTRATIAVLVEGESDRQAVLAAAVAHGVDLADGGIEVVDLGGATNVERAASVYGFGGRGLRLVGLCDEGERRYFERVLDAQDLFVCRRDLEDELIRAMGTREMLAFIDAQHDGKTFRAFQKQPAQRERTLGEHLHRFCGIRAGRKVRYARDMTVAVAPERTPEPLRALLDRVSRLADS